MRTAAKCEAEVKFRQDKGGGHTTESKSNAHFTGWEIFVPYVGYTNYLVFVLFPWTEKVE